MSHFTVLVVGGDPEAQLAPFQENNMGDCPKQYLKFNDVEAESLKEYRTGSVERVKMPDGRLLATWDDTFRVPGTFGTGTDTHKVPEGLKVVKVKFTKLYPTFERYMKDWCGYDSRDKEKGRYGYWENPNRKWDWYSLGGRWTGFFKLKDAGNFGHSFDENAAEALARKYGVEASRVMRRAELIKKGDEAAMFEDWNKRPIPSGYHLDEEIKGLLTVKYKNAKAGRAAVAPAETGFVDQARKGDIDFDGMREKAAAEARERFLRVERLLGAIEPLEVSWESLDKGKNKKLSWDEKRKIYWAQEPLKRLEEARKRQDLSKEDRSLLVWLNYADYTVGLEAYVQRARDGACSTFAVVKGGKWYQKGDMGWFGCVGNKKKPGVWEREFAKLLDETPTNTLLSVYDCHI